VNYFKEEKKEQEDKTIVLVSAMEKDNKKESNHLVQVSITPQKY